MWLTAVCVAVAFTWDGGSTTTTNTPAGSAKAKAKPAPAVVTPLATMPYVVTVWLDFGDNPQFPSTYRAAIERAFLARAMRHFGQAMRLAVTTPPSELVGVATPSPEQLKPHRGDAEKIMWIRFGEPGDSPLASRISAREFDFEFLSWGPVGRAVVDPDDDLAATAFDLFHGQFRPTLDFVGRDRNGKLSAEIKGIALQPVDTGYPLIKTGSPFKLFRDQMDTKRKLFRGEVPWTYVVVLQQSVDKLSVEIEVVSSLRSPLPTRVRRRFEVTGIAAIANGDATTRAQFVTGTDQIPVEGYEVSLRARNEKVAVRIGATDRRGRVEIKAPETGARSIIKDRNQVFQVILSIGTTTLAAFPLVPGDRDNQLVKVKIDPLVTEINGKITSMSEEMVDSVARRTVLQKRMAKVKDDFNKYNEAGDDKGRREELAKLEALVKEINALPGKDFFNKRLEDVKAFADKRKAELGRDKFGRSIMTMFKQSELVIGDYFKGETQIVVEKPEGDKVRDEGEDKKEEKSNKESGGDNKAGEDGKKEQ